MSSVEASTSGRDRRSILDLRGATRHEIPRNHLATLIVASGKAIDVHLRNVSRTGTCGSRPGALDVSLNERVLLQVSEADSCPNLSLPCRVEWVRADKTNTTIGLVFAQGPLLPGTCFDLFLDQSLRAPMARRR